MRLLSLLSLGLLLSALAYANVVAPPFCYEEEDGDPSDCFITMKFANGTLTDNEDGTFSHDQSAGGGDITDVGNCDNGACGQSTATDATFGNLQATDIGSVSTGDASFVNIQTKIGSSSPQDSSFTSVKTDRLSSTIAEVTADRGIAFGRELNSGTIITSGQGGSTFGTADGNSATLRTTSTGSVAIGYSQDQSTGTSLVEAAGTAGNVVMGYANSSSGSFDANLQSTGLGTIAMGYSLAQTANSTMNASSFGSTLFGLSYGVNFDCTMTSAGLGSVAMGGCYGLGAETTFNAGNGSSLGSVAIGLAQAGDMDSTGLGSVAIGKNVRVNGNYAVGIGQDIEAQATGAITIGKEVGNSTANTLVMGMDTTYFTMSTSGIEATFTDIEATNIGRITAGDATFNDLQLGDNQTIRFGTGSDASIDYNGQDLIVEPDLIGTGSMMVEGNLAAKDATFTNMIVDDPQGYVWIKADTNSFVYFRATEANSYIGFYMGYDSGSNDPFIGVHNVQDTNPNNDINAIQLTRSTGDVIILRDLKVDQGSTSCFMMRDTDDNGWSKATVLDGVVTWATDADGLC